MSDKNEKKCHKIDVIIPVYRGHDETLECVHSVLSSINDNQTIMNVIVINDCSPEPELTTALRDLAKQHQFSLLHNEKNLGFVGTVNRGMSLSQNDVVLLNSDTEVANNWLDRLLYHAQKNQYGKVATVTPYSNNATLCSYPRAFAENTLPANENISSMDLHCRTVNLGKSSVLPTGVGFCMFITRTALDSVGLFDEEAFGKGYGEENDFCLKSELAGFVNLHAHDIFVWHKGSVSFSESAKALQENAINVIRNRYPNYEQRIQKLITEDVSAIFRLRIAMMHVNSKPLILFEKTSEPVSKELMLQNTPTLRFAQVDDNADINISCSEFMEINSFSISQSKLSMHQQWFCQQHYKNVIADDYLPSYLGKFRAKLQQKEKTILHIVNNHGGGTLRYIESLAKHENTQSRAFVLYMGPNQQILWDVYKDHYTLLDLHDEARGWQTLPVISVLTSESQQLAVHIHSMFGEGLEYAEALPEYIAFTATLHDHYFLSDKAFANHCITQNPEHIQRIQSLMQRANSIITPSKYLFEQAKPYFEQPKLTFISHGISQPNSVLSEGSLMLANELMNIARWDKTKPTIAFIGAIGSHKGLRFIKKLMKQLYKKDYQIVILGFTADGISPSVSKTHIQHGPYHHAEVPALIKHYGIDLVVFPPAIPESYCYALSDIYATVPVLAPEIGAFQYRIKDENLGHTYPSNYSPRKLKNMIIKRFTQPMSIEEAKLNEESSMVDMTEYCYIHVNGEDWQKQGFTHTDINEFCQENLNEETLKQSLIHLAKENHTLKQRIATLKNANISPRASKSEQLQYYCWRARHYASLLVKNGLGGTLKKILTKLRG